MGLVFTVVDPDNDYLGIEIYAFNGRFSGATRIFSSEDQLLEFSKKLIGFPSKIPNDVSYEFGN